MESRVKKFKNEKEKKYLRSSSSLPSLPSSPLKLVCTDVTYSEAILRVYGITEFNQSICVHVDGFLPYLYVNSSEIDKKSLNDSIHESISEYNSNKSGEYIDDLYTVDRISLMGFSNSEYKKFTKIILKSPKYMRTCMNVLEQGQGLLTYEGNIGYELRFMIDKKFGGFDWIEIKAYKDKYNGNLSVQLEVECNEKDLIGLPDLNQPIPYAGVRQLTFDIEACRQYGFVDAKTDPIIQIGNTLFNGLYDVIDKRVFALLSSQNAGIRQPLQESDIEVETFHSESELLKRWMEYVRETDTDYLTGYNIDGFDLPYIKARCDHFKIEFNLGRDPEQLSKVKKKTFNSAATGQREDYELVAEGRSALDTLKYVKAPSSMIKLRSYSLGNVSKELLGFSKVEMPYKYIYPYQHGTDDQRAHLAYYCWWDAELCRLLWQAKMIFMDYAESARISKVPMKYFFSRGQQVLTQSLLVRYCQARGILVPSSTESQNDEDTEGADVLTPDKGLHTDPVITLDFQSLYPSIIRDANVCYSTKVPLWWARKNLKPEDYSIPPCIKNVQYCYVKEHIWMGVLPEMETTLFNKRNEFKAQMKSEKDSEKKKVFNVRQNVVKLRMNSIYGFLKANMVCDKDLMETVTGYGRYMINMTKEIVESNFPNAKVIYGDTDSVFVKFIGSSLKEAFDLGQKAADLCTAFFNKERTVLGKLPIHLLQREKGFDGIILVGKKKYVGRKMLTLQSEPELSISGLETVRRDNCLLASELLESSLDTLIMQGDFTLPTRDRIMNQKQKAIDYIHQTIRDLLSGKTDISKLIISKNISKSFEHYESIGSKLPHIELAKKIDARKHETGEQSYHVGDRVKYVITSELKGTKSSECAEDPLYALLNRKNIDYNYYVENQLMKPLLRIFTPIMNPKQVMISLSDKSIKVGAKESMVKISKKTKKQVYLNDKEITGLDSYKTLFVGDHMNIRVQKFSQDTKGEMGRFVKIQPSCLECGVKIVQRSGNTLPVCHSCAPNMQMTFMKLQGQMNNLEEKKWASWTRCQGCAKKHHTVIECENKDCDNFFQRMKLQVDLEDLQKKISLF
jgi:DNA polymerase delta subunit 1